MKGVGLVDAVPRHRARAAIAIEEADVDGVDGIGPVDGDLCVSVALVDGGLRCPKCGDGSALLVEVLEGLGGDATDETLAPVLGQGPDGVRLLVPSPCGTCSAGACSARRKGSAVITLPGEISGRIGDAVSVTVSARGLLSACGLLFLPATLVVVVLALLYETSAASLPTLSLLLAGSLACALLVSVWALRRGALGLLEVTLEEAGAAAQQRHHSWRMR